VDVASVLIVEDDEPMRRALRCMVADLVGEVHECANSEDAMTAYAALLPDWVVLDLANGGRGGFAATQQLMAAYPDARIIVVGNYDDDDLRQAAVSAGAIGYVVTENMYDVRALVRGGSERA
jgi:DNA-binding NarL/FixJ family response regulator